MISSDDPPVEQSTTQGGESYSTCTGGFVGYRSGVYGIITASHCTSKPTTYDGDTTGSTFTASSSRDLRFTALSGGTPENKVRAGSSTFTFITSVGIVSAGMNIAKYGKVTGYGSDVVESYQGCVEFVSGAIWCGLYQTQDDMTDGGDSGGPWFYINKAYAVTTGSNSSGSFISPIAYIAYISGTVTVKTS